MGGIPLRFSPPAGPCGARTTDDGDDDEEDEMNDERRATETGVMSESWEEDVTADDGAGAGMIERKDDDEDGTQKDEVGLLGGNSLRS